MQEGPEIEEPEEPQSSLKIDGDSNLVLIIEKLLMELSESTLQVNFHAATRIRCGISARRAIEALLRHDFDGYAIGESWNRRLLRWNSTEKCLQVKIGWAEYALGGALGLYFTSICVSASLFLRECLSPHGKPEQAIIFCGFAALITVSAILTNRHIWGPLRTAYDVRKLLNKERTAGAWQHGAMRAD